MATMSGTDFHNKHPHAHLVIGEYDRAWVINPKTEQTRLGLLMRLAKAIDVTGDYTMTDKVADGVIQVSFATAEDASGFAYAVQAKPSTSDPGQASKTAFDYDRAAYDKIRRALV
jgi:hypothetical protein